MNELPPIILSTTKPVNDRTPVDGANSPTLSTNTVSSSIAISCNL